MILPEFRRTLPSPVSLLIPVSIISFNLPEASISESQPLNFVVKSAIHVDILGKYCDPVSPRIRKILAKSSVVPVVIRIEVFRLLNIVSKDLVSRALDRLSAK